jgi:hypothetical protein
MARSAEPSQKENMKEEQIFDFDFLVRQQRQRDGAAGWRRQEQKKESYVIVFPVNTQVSAYLPWLLQLIVERDCLHTHRHTQRNSQGRQHQIPTEPSHRHWQTQCRPDPFQLQKQSTTLLNITHLPPPAPSIRIQEEKKRRHLRRLGCQKEKFRSSALPANGKSSRTCRVVKNSQNDTRSNQLNLLLAD